MAFDLRLWRSDVRAWWAENAPRLQTASIESAYALLASSAWLPLLAAYSQDPGTATTALVSITAGIGSNLVANVVQNAYDRTRAGQQVKDQAQDDAQSRAELDAVLQSTRALDAARDALGERWDDFASQLVREMAALPGESDLMVTLGDGTVVGGSVVAGEVTLTDSTFVGRDQIEVDGDGNVIGDHSRATLIKTGDYSPVTLTEDTRAEERIERQERALRAYLARLARESNVLHLRGVDPRAADVTNQEIMSLAAVYTQLDTDIHTPVRALSNEDRNWLIKDPSLLDYAIEEEESWVETPISALKLASEVDRLVILGDPGAGKSTFVSHLAFHLSRAILNGEELDHLPGWTRGPLVPIRVILRDSAPSVDTDRRPTSKELWRLIARTLSEADLAESIPALKDRLDGGAILLLDGLDEVDAEPRSWLLEVVEDFALTHRNTPILVTCRPYAYQEPDWRLPSFWEATLAPFNEEKINHFIVAWYAEVARLSLMSAPEAGERASRMQAALRRPDLRSMAPNPLLLTMMALLHSSWGRLPEDRVQLYGEIVELLLARWEQSHLGRDALVRAQISPRNLRFALEEVAYRTHSREPKDEGTADVAESQLREVLQSYLEGDWNRAGEAIRYVQERAGLLLERKAHLYAFPHRTLQEYLAGCYLSVQESFPRQAAELLQADETRWREPFLLAVGKTGRAENRVGLALAAVDELCPRPCTETPEEEQTWRSAWLAGEALVEIGIQRLKQRESWKVRLERVAGWLARLLEVGALKPVERAAAGRVLSKLGDPRPGVEVDADTRLPDIVWCYVPPGPFVMGEGEEQHRNETITEGYLISRYPITNAQFAAFVEAGGYQEERYWTEAQQARVWKEGQVKDRLDDYPREGPYDHGDPLNLPNHPVVGMTWYEGLAFCRWLEEQLRIAVGRLRVWRDGRIETIGSMPAAITVQLPSEAEWEKAARGKDGRRFPWGDEANANRANYRDAGIGTTSAVGCFPGGASPYGVEDLSGNVWEWTRSQAKDYPYDPEDGREDLDAGEDVARVLRGGSFNYPESYIRCTGHDGYFPSVRYWSSGFRVVAAPFSPASGPFDQATRLRSR